MEYRVLGPLEVADGPRLVDLGAPKQRAVLAVLLLARGRVVAADRIVAAVWGDDPPPAVAASLQAYVSNLRRLLRDGAGRVPIERRSPGYVLDVPEDALDGTRFLALAATARRAVAAADWAAAAAAAGQALAVWRGPVLADLRDEPWVQVDANVLEQRRCETAEHLITALLGLGRTDDAVAESARLLAAEPLRERAAWLHLVALHRAGRTVEALEAYREQARRLDDELGLEPPPALRDLQAAILRQAPELAEWPGPARPPTVAPGPAADEQEAVPAGDLVGRRRELGVIDALLRGRLAGPRWLVLTGPAGIGKTRLAEEALALAAARGAALVRTGCPDDDGVPPWWPVRQLLRALDLDPDALLTPPAETGADAARFAVYDRLESALADLPPTAVLVDDAQWADPSSLRWLAHLAAPGSPTRVDLVLTVRDGVAAPEAERLLAAIARRPDARQLAVPPLAVPEVAELATRVSGGEIRADEAGALTAHTGGNPFFVGEYARLPRSEREAGGVPVAVRSVLRRRLAAVDAEVLQVLRTAAVAGDPIDVELLRAVTRLDRDELADLLDDAAGRDLIVPVADGTGYRFAHGLLRDEVLAGLSAPRRQRVHVRIAEALRGAAGRDGAARRATHLAAALPLASADEAYAACRAAATDAEERWESEAAAEWWAAASRAYALLPAAEQDDEHRDDLLVARVAALGRAGRRQTVIDVVTDALLEAVRADRIASAGRLAAVTLRTSGIWPWTAFTVDPGPLLTRLAGIEPLVRVDPGAHARVLAALAVGNYYDPDLGVPDRLSARAIEIAERLGDPDVLADALLGRALVLSGVATRATETVQVVDRLVALPHHAGAIDAVLRHDLLSLTLMTLGDVAGAEAAMRDGAIGADRLRLPIVRVQLRWMEANLALWHGDIERSVRVAELAEELHGRTELYIMSVGGLTRLVRAWEEGRLEDMAVRLDDTQDLVWLRAALLLAPGRTDEGVAVITAALAAPGRDLWTTLGERTLAAMLVAERGATDVAQPMLDLLRPCRSMIGTFGQTGQVGVVAFAMARLAALLGRREEALGLLAEAETVAERGRGVPTLLRCRLLRAELESADPEAFAAIADEARRIGLGRVADRADALAGPVRTSA